MGTIFNDDFRDFIQAMNNHNVEYILVGGYAVILHGPTLLLNLVFPFLI
jgi:hypothetical protein